MGVKANIIAIAGQVLRARHYYAQFTMQETRPWPTPARTQPYPLGDAIPQAIIPLLQASPNGYPFCVNKTRAVFRSHSKGE